MKRACRTFRRYPVRRASRRGILATNVRLTRYVCHPGSRLHQIRNVRAMLVVVVVDEEAVCMGV